MSDLDEQTADARSAREALVGRTVAGKWVLRSLIGHGGMGAVYEAENVGIGKRAAIKFVDPEFATDEKIVARFAREARAMSAIESAHIVTVFDAGTEDGRPYLVMELLRGEDLGQRLRRTRTVPLAEALHVIAQVLKGLSRAHAAGIIHRDLKPDNVFLANVDHDPLFAKIVDFGVSKIDRPRASTMPMALTGRGTVLGTPLYMSPEQAQCSADVDARADLYSVGAILFECLTGRPPHVGETYEQVILSICTTDAPDVRSIDPNVPEAAARFVAKSLRRDRDLRFQSATEMLAALHEVAPAEKKRVPAEPALARTLPSPEVAAEPPRKSTPKVGKKKAKKQGAPLYAMAGVAALAGVGLTVGIISAMDRARDADPLPLPSAAPLPPPPVTTPLTSASQVVEPVASAPPPAVSVSVAPPKPRLPASAPKPPPSVAPRPSATGKPLDIQRDLPP